MLVSRYVFLCMTMGEVILSVSRKGQAQHAKNSMKSYMVGVPCKKICCDIIGTFPEMEAGNEAGNKWAFFRQLTLAK